MSARITFNGGKYLRLICLQKCGLMKSRCFRSTTGKADQKAIAEIKKNFNGPTFHNWLLIKLTVFVLVRYTLAFIENVFWIRNWLTNMSISDTVSMQM